ncbi:protein of unknown function [Candidatus Filomicrobium marinum]|uniref:Uncharacterized protein n=1 Tax=Candidatus Filomicrobium marinum TaxID=1608628 RepID=A0A0D6JA07_9HYPH|nr:protein of unknown function [Candidatus Filomicrobium marinum]CPR15017.1 protein of unknown function [Candidatus Filomicrobium marinum]
MLIPFLATGPEVRAAQTVFAISLTLIVGLVRVAAPRHNSQIPTSYGDGLKPALVRGLLRALSGRKNRNAEGPLCRPVRTQRRAKRLTHAMILSPGLLPAKSRVTPGA